MSEKLIYPEQGLPVEGQINPDLLQGTTANKNPSEDLTSKVERAMFRLAEKGIKTPVFFENWKERALTKGDLDPHHFCYTKGGDVRHIDNSRMYEVELRYFDGEWIREKRDLRVVPSQLRSVTFSQEHLDPIISGRIQRYESAGFMISPNQIELAKHLASILDWQEIVFKPVSAHVYSLLSYQRDERFSNSGMGVNVLMPEVLVVYGEEDVKSDFDVEQFTGELSHETIHQTLAKLFFESGDTDLVSASVGFDIIYTSLCLIINTIRNEKPHWLPQFFGMLNRKHGVSSQCDTSGLEKLLLRMLDTGCHRFHPAIKALIADMIADEMVAIRF